MPSSREEVQEEEEDKKEEDKDKEGWTSLLGGSVGVSRESLRVGRNKMREEEEEGIGHQSSLSLSLSVQVGRASERSERGECKHRTGNQRERGVYYATRAPGSDLRTGLDVSAVKFEPQGEN